MAKRNKAGTNSKSNKPGQPQKKTFSYRLVIIAIVLLLISAPWVVYLNDYETSSRNEEHLELEHYIQETITNLKVFIISNATELIVQNSNYNSNIAAFETHLNGNLEKVIDSEYRPYLVPNKDIEISINYYTLDVKPMFRTTNDLIRYPRISEFENGDYQLETYLPGTYYDTSVPISYILSLNLQLSGRQLKKSNGNGDSSEWESISRVVGLTEVLPFPHLFIEYKLQQFGNQGVSASSDIARTTQYMLTTLARMRAHNWKNDSSQASHKNFISEGDVEVILNLAVLLEETLIFHALDDETVNSIDTYFYYANEAEKRTNPTGMREWGNTENSNYLDYLNRRGFVNNQNDRLLTTLISKYVNEGFIDPADLMALYFVLDKDTKPAVITSLDDKNALLQEDYDTKNLMDPNTPDDPSDTTNLRYILTLPEEYSAGFNLSGVFNTGTVDVHAWLYQNIKLEVDQVPDYLILDRDFKLQGLNSPRGWDSTATLRQASRTRTSSVIQERPLDHDYRLEWSLRLQGQFDFNLKPKNDFMSLVPNNLGQSGTINLDFPINIYVWFYGDPKIASVDFTDLNSGGALMSGDWEITSQSHLVEYFEKEFWSYLKPIVTLGFDAQNAITSYVLSEQGFEALNEDDNRLYSNNVIAGHNPITSNWLADILLFQAESLNEIRNQNKIGFYTKFDLFMAEYFLDYLDQFEEEYQLFSFIDKPQFPHPPLVPWISALGYEVTLHYSKVTNIVNITFLHSSGYFTLLIRGYNRSAEQFNIVLKSHIELTEQPELIKLDFSIDSNSLNTGKPELTANGILFNTYQLKTMSYQKPSNPTSSTSVDSNEELLFTRTKYGAMVPVASFDSPELTLSSDLNDASIRITLLIPEDKIDAYPIPDLEGIVDSIDPISYSRFDLTDDELFLQNRIYLSTLFTDLSETLHGWLDTYNIDINPVIELSIQGGTNKEGEIIDGTSILIYFSELKNAKDFISWLGLHGVELTLILGKPEFMLKNFIESLIQDEQYFSIADLGKIDIVLSNRKIDHELQIGMNIQENIRSPYQYSTNDVLNFMLIEVYSGSALTAVAEGLSITNDGNNNEVGASTSSGKTTFTQVYYTYQPKMDNADEPLYTQLLLGTTFFKL